MDSEPAIVLVTGAWHTPAFYQPLIDALKQRDREVHCPALQTCANDSPATATLADDVAKVRGVVQDLVEKKQREVVVVAHSYGGVVSTEGLTGLSCRTRAEKGLKGGVRRLAYMAAFVPHQGQSLAGILGGGYPPFVDVKEKENILAVPDPGPTFYNDLPAEEAAYWASRVTLHPNTAQFTPVTNEAWREIPLTYIFCEKDAALLPPLQQMMIDAVTAVGVSMAVEKISASHSPFLSMPQTVADLIVRIGSEG